MSALLGFIESGCFTRKTGYGHASNGWTVLVCVRVHSRRPCCFVFAAGHWPHLRTPPGVLQDNSGTAIVGFTVILSNVSGKAAYTRTELRVGWRRGAYRATPSRSVQRESSWTATPIRSRGPGK